MTAYPTASSEMDGWGKPDTQIITVNEMQSTYPTASSELMDGWMDGVI